MLERVNYYTPERRRAAMLVEVAMEVRAAGTELVKRDRHEAMHYREMTNAATELLDTLNELVKHDEAENKLHARVKALGRQIAELLGNGNAPGGANVQRV